MFRVRRFLRTLKPVTLRRFIFFLILLIFCLIFNFVEHKLTPNILAMAETQAKNIAIEAINKTVKEKIAKNVQYRDLISIHKDTSGQITLVQINTIEINRLEAETILEVINVLREATMEGISLPLGAVTGSKLLSNYGPKMKVSLIPAGTAYVNTIEAFEEAGINQTRHRIFFEIIADIRIVLPYFDSEITVKTDVPLAETIIIGDVPSAILDFKY
ncbi:MAG: sporulation protein YunB [Thermoanaerobacteraceae bacterium]|nr:sporulation protein YunB [Thermoanaerobacteraceae bacterium]